MARSLHQQIAYFAQRLGMLPAATQPRMVRELVRIDSHRPARGPEVWVERGWLDGAQLQEILDLLAAHQGADAPTLPAPWLPAPGPQTPEGASNVSPAPSVPLADPPAALPAPENHTTLDDLDAPPPDFASLGMAAESATFDSVPGGSGRQSGVYRLANLLLEPRVSEPWAREPTASLPTPAVAATPADSRGGEERWPAPGAPAPQEISESPESPASRALPAVQAGRYVLGDELGRGGTARVVRAYDRVLRRTVAMKILRAEARSAADTQARMALEAQTTGQLEHPNIVPIYDYGHLPTGEAYYTMREIRRHSLREALRALKRGEPATAQEFTLVRLLHVLKQVCQAVDYAHARGVIHRDLKPDNIMLGDYGEVLVMDWGLARVLHRQTAAVAATAERGHTLGTPAYMPPEQARGELHEIDERSDVYSLGAILYEILTLEPPFVGPTPLDVMWEVVDGTLAPPSARATAYGRAVPAEVERICLRAMRRHKPERFASVRELEHELQNWLEGLQPREAARRLEDGFRAAEAFRAHQERVAELEREVREVSRQIASWQPPENKRPLWDLEDARERAQLDSAQAFGESVTSFAQALAYQPGHPLALQGLASIYLWRYEQAEAKGLKADAIYFRALVEQFDDGRLQGRLASRAELAVHSDPPGARVRLARFEELDRRLGVTHWREAGRTPLQGLTLELGSYLAVLEHPARAPVRLPLLVERGQSGLLTTSLPELDALEPGFVFIPAGAFTSGGDTEAFDPRPAQRLDLPAFYCQQFPVSFGQYLEWVNHLQATDPPEALRRAPQTRGSEGLIVRLDPAAGLWIPDEILIEGRARELYPVGQGHEVNLPVVGVSIEDARAYCQWRAARDGRPYRLPTPEEWEKAARGPDGRLFPWGMRFDATFCKMRASRPQMPQLEPVGAFPHDTSPYGVRDMSGGVQEWCEPGEEAPRGQDVPVRGGAWNQDERACRPASQSRALWAARTGFIGFRMVYSLPQ